jgi:sulfur carrier protein
MQIVVNGEAKIIAAEMTVSGLLESLGLGRAACAVEVNKDLVLKRDHAGRQIREGDKIEIVTLVGGG